MSDIAGTPVANPDEVSKVRGLVNLVKMMTKSAKNPVQPDELGLFMVSTVGPDPPAESATHRSARPAILAFSADPMRSKIHILILSRDQMGSNFQHPLVNCSMYDGIQWDHISETPKTADTKVGSKYIELTIMP